MFKIPIMLLEMVWLEEEPLEPEDLVIPHLRVLLLGQGRNPVGGNLNPDTVIHSGLEP
jgi:hypothetical protein